MSSNAVPTFGAIQGPIVDSNGYPTPAFQRWLTQLQGKTAFNIDPMGIILPNGIDFARGYTNKNQDNIPDTSTHVRLAASHASGNVAYNFKGVWSGATAYVIGDEVVFGQSYWLALAASTNSQPATSNANWQVIGSYSGFQGAWNSATAYAVGAEVTDGGNYWVCVTANTNSAPSLTNPNWQVAGPANLDNIAQGVTYGSVKQTELASNTVKQLNDGSNVRTAGDVSTVVKAGGHLQSTAVIDGRTEAIGTTVQQLNSSGQLVNADQIAADGTGSPLAGGRRGFSTIDGSNIVVASGIDFSRSYSNKHLGNIPDDAGSSRYAVLGVDSNRRAIIDYGQTAHVGTLLPAKHDPYVRDGNDVAYNRSLIAVGAGAVAGRGPCADVNDGTNLNNWNCPTSSLPTSIVIDLGMTCFEFGYVSFNSYFPTDNRFLPSAGSVDLSADNVTWQTGKGSWSGAAADPVVVPLTQPSAGAQYVRINFTGAPINPSGQTTTQISNLIVMALNGGQVQHLDFNILDTGTYGRPLNSRLSSGKPFIDFSEGIHLNKNLDNVPNGTRAAWDSTTQKSAAVDANGNLLLKNIAAAVPVTVSPSTTSTTYSVIPELTQTVTTKGNRVLLTFAMSCTSSNTASVLFAFFRDGVQITTDFLKSTTGNDIVSFSFIDSPAAGSHTFDVRWRMNGAGSTGSVCSGVARTFQAVELG